MVWLLGIPTDRKSFPQVAANACSDRLLYLPFQKIMTQRNIVALEAEGRGIYLYSLFVCLLLSALLCSVLFPLIFAEPFFCVLTLSLFCRVELTLTHFFLARKKMDDNNSGGGGGGGF